MKQYCLHGFQGLVELRKTRQGPIVGIYNSDQGGVDEAEEGRWSTVCEGHGVSINHSTLALARQHASDPHGWCERCIDGEPLDVEAPTIPYAGRKDFMEDICMTFDSREEILKRLADVDTSNHARTKLHPVLAREAGKEVVVSGVVMLVHLALTDYATGMPVIGQALIHRQLDKYVKAMIGPNNPQVLEEAKKLLIEIARA